MILDTAFAHMFQLPMHMYVGHFTESSTKWKYIAITKTNGFLLKKNSYQGAAPFKKSSKNVDDVGLWLNPVKWAINKTFLFFIQF